jgi:hypothetical protein
VRFFSEHPVVADYVVVLRRPFAFQASADHIGLFEDGDVLAWSAAVFDQKGGAGKRGDATAD